jgi:hypothetical protein
MRFHRLLRWVIAPEKLEYLEGDLLELGGLRTPCGPKASLLQLRDTLSICLRHSRFTTPHWRFRLATAALTIAVLLTLLQPERRLPVTSVVTASDPAGVFTLEFRNRQVIAATINGRPIESGRLQQQGNELVITGGDRGRDFRIELTGEGIRWQARQPSPE